MTGPATVNGATGYRYRATVTDGADGDSFAIEVTKGLLWSYRASGRLGGGNVKVRAG